MSPLVEEVAITVVELSSIERKLSDTAVAVAVLGYVGKMITGSKLEYSSEHPDHTVFFNANVYDSAGQKVWYGDIDLTASATKLKECALKLGQTIYVTREMPFRFDHSVTVEKLRAACLGKFPSAVAFDP